MVVVSGPDGRSRPTLWGLLGTKWGLGSSLLLLTTVVCAGEVWGGSRALGHQDQSSHHRPLRYDQRPAQGNNLLGNMTVSSRDLSVGEIVFLNYVLGLCGTSLLPWVWGFLSRVHPWQEVQIQKTTHKLFLTTWQLFTCSVCQGFWLWPLMLGYPIAWSHDSRSLY